ncbi:substrate-binding domain-containing protein, partial [Parasulfuritortus cantonensis]|uniref:substrate-binding domain-containing protein n=1 Tax=Parasulfuritortus cantonensis TaxID=2528202 RepID=UPI0014053A4F
MTGPVPISYGTGARAFAVAAGSPGELGLLEQLALPFCRHEDATMNWIKAGTGLSLRLLRERAVDMVLVHAPEEVDTAMSEGWAVGKTLIGSNAFYVVGPVADPARVSEAHSAAEAFRRIHADARPFVSRADQSGTHRKELQLWRRLGIAPTGPWYVESGDFMAASLRLANDIGAYFLCDSSTWLMEAASLSNLGLLFQGDPVLVNVYHALLAPAGATTGRDTAQRFVEFLA